MLHKHGSVGIYHKKLYLDKRRINPLQLFCLLIFLTLPVTSCTKANNKIEVPADKTITDDPAITQVPVNGYSNTLLTAAPAPEITLIPTLTPTLAANPTPTHTPYNPTVHNPEVPAVKIAQWNDVYDLQWAFTGEMKHHYILRRFGDVLLVYGHDGGISGHHDHEYLYGINAETGREIWSVYGGYLGVYYTVSSETGKVFAAVKANDWTLPRLMCLDVYTGDIQWEQELTGMDSYYPASVSVGDAAVFLLYSPEGSILKAFDKTKGNLLWKKNVDSDDRLVECHHDAPGLVIRKNDKTQGLDWVTGKSLWSIPDSKWSHTKFTREGGVLKTLDDFQGKGEQMESWLTFEEEFNYVNTQSGQVLDSISNDAGVRRILPLNHEYIIVLEYDSEVEYLGEVQSFFLYSISEKKELWFSNEEMIGAVLDNNTLYYITDLAIKSVNVSTGTENWNQPFSADIQKYPMNNVSASGERNIIALLLKDLSKLSVQIIK